MVSRAHVSVATALLTACCGCSTSSSDSASSSAAAVVPAATTSSVVATTSAGVTTSGVVAPTITFSPALVPVSGRILFTIEQRSKPAQLAFIDASGFHIINAPLGDVFGGAVWDGADNIVLDREESGLHHIFRVGVDGTGLVEVIGGDDQQDLPSLSPDRSLLVYGDFSTQQDLGVHEANSDGSNVKALTEASPIGSKTGNDGPEFSPDGKSIAYVHIVDGDKGLAELWVMRADGTGAHRLTDASSNASHPHWSPDGARILYSETEDGAGPAALGVIDAVGGSPRPMTDPGDPGASAEGTWSPDGTQIVFRYYLKGWDHNELRIVNADGTGMRTLWVGPPLGSAETPDWST